MLLHDHPNFAAFGRRFFIGAATAAHIQTVIKDDLGKPFDPTSLPHSYTYDENGNVLTDTCVAAGSITRVKTYGGWTQYGTVWCAETEGQWINVTESNVD